MPRIIASLLFTVIALVSTTGCATGYTYVKVFGGDGTPVPQMVTPTQKKVPRYPTRRVIGEWTNYVDANGRQCRKSPVYGTYRRNSDEVLSSEQSRLCEWVDNFDGAVCESKHVSREDYKRRGLNELTQEHSHSCSYVWNGRRCTRGVRTNGRSFDTCAIRLKPIIVN